MHLQPANADDIPRLIEILFTAFSNDSLLVGTCYPDTLANRQWWIRNIQSQIQHPQTLVHKVVNDKGRIIAWAKWLVQRKSNSDADSLHGAVNPDNAPSPDVNLTACRSLAAGQYKMRDEILCGRDHYWLNAIATDPAHQRHGAATLLVRHGVGLADEKGLECFSAFTTQANVNMAKILGDSGFEIVASEPVELGGGSCVHAGYRKPKKL